MPVTNLKITYNGEDLIVPDREMIEHFSRVLPPCILSKIGFYTYTATASDGSEGYFFATRSTMLALINEVMYDTDQRGQATLKMISSDGDSVSDIDFPNVYIGPLTRQLHSTKSEGLYLLHLVDQRYWSTHMLKTKTLEYNVLMPDGSSYQFDSLKTVSPLPTDGQTASGGSTFTSPGSQFITDKFQPGNLTLIAGAGADAGQWQVLSIGSETTLIVEGSFADTNTGITWLMPRPYKWSEVADSIFQEMKLVTTTSQLGVPTDDPKADPQDLQFPSVPASMALDLLLALNGWTFIYNPFTTACSVEDEYTPVSPIYSVLGGLVDQLIMGGLTHVQYNYDTHDQPGDKDKYLGSDLYALPFVPGMTVPRTFKLVFPARFQHGRYPSRQSDSVDSKQTIPSLLIINNVVFDAMTSPASDDFEDAFLPYTHTSSEFIWHDSFPAVLNKNSPYGLTNGTALTARKDYMVLRIAALMVSPKGVLVYDGWHKILPSPEVYRVSIGIKDGIPQTILDLSYRPDPMFGKKFLDEAVGIGLTGTNTSIAQRSNADYFMHPNTALFPFFDNTPGLPA